MKRIPIIALICICALTLSSCSTVFCGAKAKVTFDSNIDESATMTINDKEINDVTFPYTTKVKRGYKKTIVQVEAPSYETETVVIKKKFNPISIINLTGIIGWGIDAATGAITKPQYKQYNIEMTPKQEAQSK